MGKRTRIINDPSDLVPLLRTYELSGRIPTRKFLTYFLQIGIQRMNLKNSFR